MSDPYAGVEEQSFVDRLDQTIGYGESTDASGTDHYFAGFSDINDPATGSSSTSLGGHLDVSDTGVHADVAGGSFNIQGEDGGFSVGGFTASAEAVWDRDGYYGAGAQANIAEGSVNYGAQRGDTASADDLYLRGGVSEGVGAAGRAYVGTDVDGDGVREYGLGGDYMWGSGDVRIESQTLTEAHQTASEAYDYAAAEAEAAYDYAGTQADAAYDYAGTQAEAVYDDAATEAEAGYESAGQAYDAAVETATEAYDSAAETANEAYDSAAETANEAYDSAAETANEAYDYVFGDGESGS